MSRLLIIEDDPDLAELMAITLRTAGHEVCLAADGATALQALRDRLPDLIVLDLMLPDIVGISLCENLRREHQLDAGQLPILMTSACDERDVAPLARSAGANDFLAKPFTPYQLLVRVHALLARPRQQVLAS
jgi:DNA-binding response OmpR family regulator